MGGTRVSVRVGALEDWKIGADEREDLRIRIVARSEVVVRGE